jgi:PPOX class probable F420-dependent enzyme
MSAAAVDPAKEKYVNLATFRRNGVEVKTPVWIAPMDGRHYVFSEGEAGKVKRIRSNPRVRLAACDMRGNVWGGWIDGRARIVEDTVLVSRVRAAFRRKYGWIIRLTDLLAGISGRLQRRAYIEIELT